MEELAGGAHVSFEGDLRGLTLLSIPGASEEPTAALKRNNAVAKARFVVVPLEPFMAQKIIDCYRWNCSWSHNSHSNRERMVSFNSEPTTISIRSVFASGAQ